MPKGLEIIPSRPAHVGRLAANLRAIDRMEAMAVWGMQPKAALRACRRRSLWSLTATVDGKPEAMFGLAVASMVEGHGIPWFLGTDAVYRHGREMLARGPAVIAHMRRVTPSLGNIVASRNVRAVRLLRRWGFEIGTEIEVHGGVEFLPFRMEA